MSQFRNHINAKSTVLLTLPGQLMPGQTCFGRTFSVGRSAEGVMHRDFTA